MGILPMLVSDYHSREGFSALPRDEKATPVSF
jgi:hypothetical protein